MAHLWLPAAVLLFAKRTWAQGARTRAAADQSSRRAPSAAKDGLARLIIPYADSGRSRKNAVTSPLKGVLSQILDAKTEPDTLPSTGVVNHERARWGRNYGPRRPNPAHVNGQRWTPAICGSRSTTVVARSGGQGAAGSNTASPTLFGLIRGQFGHGGGLWDQVEFHESFT
jgi:hypothetical protein